MARGSLYGTTSGAPTLRTTQDDASDQLLGRDPLALLLGMLFDQHVRRRSSSQVVVTASGVRRQRFCA